MFIGIHEMGSDPAALHASGNISSNQQNNRTASVALLNYFAFLGTTSEKSRADYAYMENLLLSAGIHRECTVNQILFQVTIFT